MLPRRIILFIFIVSCFAFSEAENNSAKIFAPCTKNILQDSLPPLHTINEKDISTVTSSFENNTITVTLKNGATYIYNWIDWDLEDSYPSLCKRLRDEIRSITLTFTKTEQAPSFPGGEDAWNKYMQEFNAQHGKKLKGEEPMEFMVQFIVHLKGQITNLEVIGDPQTKFSKLAAQAMQNSPPWNPAIQNGHKVVCYMRWTIRLN